MNYKKIIALLLVANVAILIVAAIALRSNKLNRQQERYLRGEDRYATGVSAKSGLSKQEVLEGLAIQYRMARDHRVTNADLTRLISLIKQGFTKDRSGGTLVAFGNSFGKRLVVGEPQKGEIGRLCILIVREATQDDNRLYALYTISLMRITGVRADLAPFANDKNPEIVKMVRRLTRQLATAEGISGDQ